MEIENIVQAAELRHKIELGMECHKTLTMESCEKCPYVNTDDCGWCIMNDALALADYWRNKYKTSPKQVVVDTRVEPTIVKVDSIDIRNAEKYTKAMKNAGNAAKFASEAFRELTDTLHELKGELDNEPPKITEASVARWLTWRDVTGNRIVGYCSCCNNREEILTGNGEQLPAICPQCKAVMTGVE